MDPIAGQTSILGERAPTISVNVEQMNFLGVLDATWGQMEEVKMNLKIKKEMLKSELAMHQEYVDSEAALKSAREFHKKIKTTVMGDAIIGGLEDDILSLKGSLKLKKEIISDVATQYRDTTGASQIEVSGGRLLTIVRSAKLVKAKKVR